MTTHYAQENQKFPSPAELNRRLEMSRIGIARKLWSDFCAAPSWSAVLEALAWLLAVIGGTLLMAGVAGYFSP